MSAKRHFTPDCQKTFRLFLLLTLIFSFGFIGDPGWTAEGLFIDMAISPSLNAQIEKAQPNPTVIRSRFIKVNFEHLGRSLLPEAADPVSLNLFEDAFFIARKDRVEWRSETRFSWFGHIEGEENSHVILVVEDGIVVGNIILYGHIYHVRFMEDGVHAVQEIDQSGFPDEAPPIPTQYPLTPEVSAAPETEQDSCDMIDVLVVYTAAAVTGAGGTAAMTSLIQLAIDETNQSYANSNITQRVRLVRSQQVTYTETGNLCDGTGNSDLYRLQNSSDGYMDSVHTLRDTYGADIVVLLVENGGSACGCSFMQGTVSASFQDHAFAVVARDCATGYYSFGHEMGHVMGARHDWYVDSTNGSPYTYNHGFVYKPNRWRTIMAYNNDCYDSGFDCTRIPYWSNPLVTYGGVPMGVTEGGYHAADNRKTLNNTACTVANFRTSITPSQKPNLTPYQPAGWSDKIVVSNVTGTTTDSSPLYSTDTLYVDWAVLNNGSVGTGGGFSVALYVDGALKNTFSRTTSLDVNYYWYWSDYLIGSLTTGTHTLKIVADSSGAIDESNEGDNEYTKTITIQSTCSYSISPTSNSFTAAAGTGSVNVTAGAGCSWTASTTSGSWDWIGISSGWSGGGNGTVNYFVLANNTGGTRTGTLTIVGQTFTITQQAGGCSYSISPTSNSFTGAAGTGSVNVTAGAGCSWTASTNSGSWAWIGISSGWSGGGNGTVNYFVLANNTGGTRTGTLTIAGKTFTITQQAGGCSYSISPTSSTFSSGSSSGSVNVTAGAGCSWTASTTSGSWDWIGISSGWSGSGNGTVNYFVLANNTGGTRTGTLTIAGQTFTITQQAGGGCLYSISPTNSTFNSGAGSGSVNVTAGAGCSWTASTNSGSWDWIGISSGWSGSGNGTVNYFVLTNGTSGSRTGTLSIAGQTFTITQQGK